jgi:nucleoid-associated protein YgaU/DNA-binding SARP family transcriptional activator
MALLLLVAGVPAVLLWLGSELPLDLSLLKVEALMRPDDGRLLILVLYAIGWLAWATFAASVSVEIVAVARGIPAPTLPGIGGVQRGAAGLVAAAALLTASPVAPAQAGAVDAVPVATAGLVVTDTPVVPAPTAGETDRLAAIEPSPAYPTITVRRHDTLWSLAERHLGDGARYTEILELNRGVPQQDGRTLENTSWLYPGWVLRLPLDAQGAGGRDDDAAAAVVVEPGDTLWEIAEDELGDGARYGEIFDENVGDPQPGGDRLTDPNLILVGWELDIPGAANESGQPNSASVEASSAGPEQQSRKVEAPEGPSAQAAPSAHAAEAVAPAERAPADAAPIPAQATDTSDSISIAEEGGDAELEEPADVAPSSGLLALGIGGIALAGFVGEVTRRRRFQQHKRRRGEQLPMPSGETATVEARARALADAPRADLLRDALRALAVSAREAGRPLPDVRTVRIRTDGIDLVVHGDEQPLAPFVGSGGTWTLDRASLVAFAPGSLDPYPVLVTIGADGDDVIMLNLESVGGLAVTGESLAVEGVVRALAADLALTAGASTVLLLGIGQDLAASLDPGRIVVAIDDAHVERYVEAHEGLWRAALDEAHAADLRCLRTEGDSEVTQGCLVVVSAEPADASPTPWSGVVRVQIGSFQEGGGERLEVRGGGACTLEHAEMALLPAVLSESVEASVVHALDLADQPTAAPTPVPQPLVPADLAVVPSRGTGPRVLLLGRVEVVNVAGKCVEQRVARLTEAVAYLALNPGATREELAEAIWAGRRVEQATKWNLVSRVRTWLGVDENSQHYLQTVPGHGVDRLRLAPAVTTDWQDFQRLAESGLRGGSTPSSEDLARALDLVRGRPFLGIDSRRYAWAEPHVQQMVSLILDWSTAAATEFLRRDDCRAARKAAMCGLSIDPANDGLARLAIDASAALGDDAGAGRIQERHDLEVRALEDEFGDDSARRDRMPA